MEDKLEGASNKNTLKLESSNKNLADYILYYTILDDTVLEVLYVLYENLDDQQAKLLENRFTQFFRNFDTKVKLQKLYILEWVSPQVIPIKRV